ncbi:MAG: RNA polymerase sigma factor [Chloroflexota bacterium]
MQHVSIAAARVPIARVKTAERFEQIYREMVGPVFGYVRFRVGDLHVAEDLTAEVFERALPRLASVRRSESVRSWLFAIARNVVADARRAAPSGTSSVSLEWAAGAEALHDGHPPPATLRDLATSGRAESAEWEVIRREEIRRLLAHVASLDERAREVVGLRFAAALRHREIGRVLGISESNAAQILHRALAELRRRVQDDLAPGHLPVPGHASAVAAGGEPPE